MLNTLISVRFSNKQPIIINKQAVKDSLARVSVLANEKFKSVTLDIQQGIIKISANNPEHDEAIEELETDYAGEAITITFNAQYISDALSNIESENALLTVASNASSCFVDEPQQCEYKFIVMPVRI
jgi:DNA polymerase III subunit beta